MYYGNSPYPPIDNDPYYGDEASSSESDNETSSLAHDALTSAATAVLPSAIDSGTACYLASLHSTHSYVNIGQNPMPEGGLSPAVFVGTESMPWLSGLQGVYKFLGVATFVAFGYSVWDDCHHSNPKGRIAIDTVGLIAAAIIGGVVLAPLELALVPGILASAGVGFVIGMITSSVKREAYGDN